jgi:hypothetical protein
MTRIAEALAEHPAEGEKTWLHQCAGARYHSPTPLLVSAVSVDEASEWLCGTCEDNLAVFLTLMNGSNGTLDWAVRREFGNLLRALGMRAWEHRGSHG